MKTWLNTLAAVLFAAAGAAGAAHAQEVSFRSGVVTDIAPIQVAAKPAGNNTSGGNRTTGAFGRALSRVAGRAASRVSGEYSYDAYQVASGATQDAVAAAGNAAPAAAGGQTVTAFMVMIKFDDGQESAIQIPDASNLQKGGRVRVFGSGSAAQIVPQS